MWCVVSAWCEQYERASDAAGSCETFEKHAVKGKLTLDHATSLSSASFTHCPAKSCTPEPSNTPEKSPMSVNENNPIEYRMVVAAAIPINANTSLASSSCCQRRNSGGR
jgi:hypothetical protein